MFLLSFSKRDKLQSHSRPTLRDLQTKTTTNPSPTPSPILTLASEQPGTLLDSQTGIGAPSLGLTTSSSPQNDISLANVIVPLESIKPSKMIGLKHLHFGSYVDGINVTKHKWTVRLRWINLCQLVIVVS